MAKEIIRLILSKERMIRGEVAPVGAILMEGECLNGVFPSDINKAILSNQVQVVVAASEEKKKNGKIKGQHANDAQGAT